MLMNPFVVGSTWWQLAASLQDTLFRMPVIVVVLHMVARMRRGFAISSPAARWLMTGMQESCHSIPNAPNLPGDPMYLLLVHMLLGLVLVYDNARRALHSIYIMT